MSLCRSFETDKYTGYVILGSGIINATMKNDESINYVGNINNVIDDTLSNDIKEIIYKTRIIATGKR